MTRSDLEPIVRWVAPGARVLDLGCGDGSLLKELWQAKRAPGYGVEIDDTGVLACLRNDVNVLQMDLEGGLSAFRDDSFDYVILSETLQAIRHTEQLVREMLRVGREAIVSFPNFGYWKARMQVFFGSMPVSSELPYQWYDTPNVHLCTVRDFEAFCGRLGVRILERLVLHDARAVTVLPNLLGSVAVFRLGRVEALGFAMAGPPTRDLARTTLVVLAIGGLMGASLWILRPFVPALIWATMIVVATWPLLLGLQKRLWKQRWLAVTVLIIALVVVFVLPFWLAISAIVSNAEEIASWAKSLSTLQLPQPWEWIRRIPFIGEKAYVRWLELTAFGPEELASLATPYAQEAMRWFAAEVGSFGLMAVQVPLTLIIACVLYVWGERSAEGARRFGRRLAGERGERAINLAGRAIRAVALGVVLTALAQSILGGVALWIAGVPFAGILTSVMFMLALAQIGAVPVLLCAAAWLYWRGSIGWMIALIVWSVIVGSLDNIMRPLLIRQGADLSLLLIFAGVIGGLLAFGLVGIFVGPVVLAVAYTLLDAWLREEPEASGTGT